jgi:hypothetical protein
MDNTFCNKRVDESFDHALADHGTADTRQAATTPIRAMNAMQGGGIASGRMSTVSDNFAQFLLKDEMPISA